MKNARLLLTVMLGSVFVFGSSIAPFYIEKRLLDGVCEAAKRGESRAVAFSVLRQVAEGFPEKIGEEDALRVGLTMYQLRRLHDPLSKASELRVYAYLKIADTGLPEAKAYLRGLTQNTIGLQRESNAVWRAVRIAVLKVAMQEAPDTDAQIQMLERAVEQSYKLPSAGSPGHWAVNELCQRGRLTSFPVVQSWFLTKDPGPRGVESVRFCEARMRAIASNPNRAKAVGSVLTTDGAIKDERLTHWAIYELEDIGSDDAKAELRRFDAAIARLPEGSHESVRLGEFRGEIRHALSSQR